MLIAVLSDTHGWMPPSLPERLAGADEIWHLGDVCDPAVLGELEILGPPVRVVQGNCDDYFGWPPALQLERGGVLFYLTHIPPVRVPPGTQVVLHGHTHVPRDERTEGLRWLNPGSASEPRGGHPPSFAWLEVAEGRLTRWEVVPI